MFFKMPVTVYEEQNCVLNHKKELACLGKKAIIITGKKSSKENGSLNDVKSALEEEKKEYIVFDNIEENPSVETVMKAAGLGLEENADFVIGVGGGSPLDAAKAVSVMMYNKDKNESFLFEKTDTPKAYPIAEVPTTCGTGSEVTAVSVLTLHSKRTKQSMSHRIFPNLALIDCKYLKTADLSILSSTSLDALGHLIESYFNTASTDFSRMLVSEGLRVWSKAYDVLRGQRKPRYEDYKALIHSSALGGMAIAHTSTTIPHALSYPLTYELGLSHGRAVGCFLPQYLQEAEKGERDYVLSLSGFNGMDEFKEFADYVCKNVKVGKDLLERAVNTVWGNKAKLKSCPFEVNETVLRKIAGL